MGDSLLGPEGITDDISDDITAAYLNRTPSVTESKERPEKETEEERESKEER